MKQAHNTLKKSYRSYFRRAQIRWVIWRSSRHPGNVPGTNRVCPRDKVGLSQGQTQVFFLFYTAEAQFVPRTNPVCPGDKPGTKGGRQSLCVKSLCAFLVPYCRRGKTWAIAFRRFFLNSAILLNSGCFPWEFSSEFAPWKCLLKYSFRYGPSFSSLIPLVSALLSGGPTQPPLQLGPL